MNAREICEGKLATRIIAKKLCKELALQDTSSRRGGFVCVEDGHGNKCRVVMAWGKGRIRWAICLRQKGCIITGLKAIMPASPLKDMTESVNFFGKEILAYFEKYVKPSPRS